MNINMKKKTYEVFFKSIKFGAFSNIYILSFFISVRVTGFDDKRNEYLFLPLLLGEALPINFP